MDMRSKTLRHVLAVGLAVLIGTSMRAAADDVKLPAESEAVLVFNVKALLNSKLVKDNNLIDLAKGAMPEDAKQFFGALGVDPFTDVESVVVTGHGNPTKGDGKLLVLVNGKFDAKKVGIQAEKNPEVKVHKVAGQAVYEVPGKDGQNGFVAVSGTSQLVASNDKGLTAEIAGGKGLGKPTKAMAAALAKLSGNETISITALVTDEVKKALEANKQTAVLADSLVAVTGGMTVTDGVQLALRAHTTDEKGANAVKLILAVGKGFLATAVEQQKNVPDAAKKLVKAIQVESDGSSASLTLNISASLIEELKKLDK